MPSRRVIRDEEILRTAVDPDAAKQRLNELRKERELLATEKLDAAQLAALTESLKLKEAELSGRERHQWEKEDAFYKEQATKRHALEQREHEAEDLLLKARERLVAADKRHTELDIREAATVTGEADLQRAREQFAKEKQDFAAHQASEKAARDALVRQLQGVSL